MTQVVFTLPLPEPAPLTFTVKEPSVKNPVKVTPEVSPVALYE
jgi:hypothetical protein